MQSLHPLQSPAWIAAKQKLGTHYLFFDGKDNHNNSLNLAISVHQVPILGKFGYIARSLLPSITTLQNLQKFAKDKSLVAILLEPNVTALPENYLDFLTKSKFSLFPEYTLTLDLTKSQSQLLAEMHPKTRYNIRLATKKNVLVREDNSSDAFEKFIKLYFQTCKRQKYFGHDYRYHLEIFQSMSANKQATILTAYFEELPLASYELFFNQDTLFYPYGGTSEQMREKMASTLLMWEAIKFGQSKGLTSFDMWGSATPDSTTNDSWNGFTRFKLGFGASYQKMIGSYWLNVDNKRAHLLQNALKLRKVLLEIYKKII